MSCSVFFTVCKNKRLHRLNQRWVPIPSLHAFDFGRSAIDPPTAAVCIGVSGQAAFQQPYLFTQQNSLQIFYG